MAEFYFAPFRFDTTNQQLWKGAEQVPLRPQSLAVLHYLIVHRERCVPTAELRSACWRNVRVGVNNVKVCIKDIRYVLGDTAKAPTFIETKPRRGYQFIGTLTPPSPSLQAPAPQCVSREVELRHLQTYLAQALIGNRQLIFVTGEPGIGKTTVVQEFLKRVAAQHNSLLISGSCREQYGIEETYQAVREGLDQLSKSCEGPALLPLLRQHAPMWLAQFPSLLSPADRVTLQHELVGATSQRMLREFTTLVELLGADRGVILVLEDLHWSDMSTLQLIAALAQRCHPAQLLLIGTFRPAEVQRNGHPLRQLTAGLFLRGAAQELPLRFLTETAIAEYLANRIPTTIPLRELAQLLHQRTHGNPLFLVNMLNELLKHQGERLAEYPSLAAQVQALQIPDNIRQLIEYQFETLSPQEQQLLEAASLVGMQFSTAALAAGIQVEMDVVEQLCHELARHSLFFYASGIKEWPDGTLTQQYHFGHALYQEVLAERLTGVRRVNMHRRIGERLEAGWMEQGGAIATELAFHFEQARQYPRAVRFHEQAGHNAARRFAQHEAISHFARGLELLKKLPPATDDQQELRLQIGLGTLLPLTKGYTVPQVEAVYARALALSQKLADTPQLFPPLFGLIRYYATRGELRTADQLGRRLLRLALHHPDPIFLPTAHTARGVPLLFLGSLVAARGHCAQASALYEPQKHGSLTAMFGEDPKVVGAGFGSWVLWYLGYPDRALAHCDTALAVAQQVSHPFNVTLSQMSATWLHYLCGAVEEMQQWVDRLIHYATEKELFVWLAPGHTLKGWTLATCGYHEAGIALMHQGFKELQTMGAELWSTVYRVLLVEVYLHRGRLEDARHALEEVSTKAKTIGEFFHTAEIHRVHGVLLLAEGRELEAETCFQQARELAQRQQARSLELRAATSLARLWQQQGKTPQARQLLAAIYGWFTEGFDTADLQQARALLDELS